MCSIPRRLVRSQKRVGMEEGRMAGWRQCELPDLVDSCDSLPVTSAIPVCLEVVITAFVSCSTETEARNGKSTN